MQATSSIFADINLFAIPDNLHSYSIPVLAAFPDAGMRIMQNTMAGQRLSKSENKPSKHKINNIKSSPVQNLARKR
jgi:hypothetical protein